MDFVLIKCGGSVLEQLPDSFYKDVVEFQKSGQGYPVIVHGGGPLISSLLKKLEIETKFVNGLRVTSDEVLDIVEMVLSGRVNKQVVRKLNQAGGKAFGISGIDGGLLKAKPLQNSNLGYVGEVESVNSELIKELCMQGYIPVISPLATDDIEGQRYNINADAAASAIAQALEARLCFISDIPGVYVEEESKQVVLPEITKNQAEQLIQEKVITGGMIPKIRAALDSLVSQVPEVVILNGFEKNSLVKFCQGQEVGTRLIIGEEVCDVQYSS